MPDERLVDFYNAGGDFKDYVDKYCVKNNIDPLEAMQHIMIHDVYDYYMDIESRRAKK